MLALSVLRSGTRVYRVLTKSTTCDTLTQARTFGGTHQYNSFGALKSRPRGRPISPHVSIYAFPLPAITSILHRATGTGLALGFVAASIPVLINPALIVPVMAWIKSYPLIHISLKFALSYGFSMHLLTGCRHLYWDYTGKGIDKVTQFDASSRAVFWGALILAVCLTFINLNF